MSIESLCGNVYTQIGDDESTQMSFDPEQIDDLIEKLERAKMDATKFRDACAKDGANVPRLMKAEMKTQQKV